MRIKNSLLRALCAVFVVVGLLAVACGPGEEKPAETGEAAAPAATAPAAGSAATIAGMQQGDATITGTVTYVGAVPTFKPIAMDADPTCAAKHDEAVYPQTLELGSGNTMASAFVQVKGIEGGNAAPPSSPVTIDQEGCLYHPHVAGVMAGQPLQFKNSDGILHNVHGLPEKNREFNLGMPASLTEKSVTLNTPELYFPVKCDVHPWMSAYVAVMTHPYFDVTETDGAFEIKVPAGTYTLEAWHERLGTQTQEVTVAAGQSASADFQFDVPKG